MEKDSTPKKPISTPQTSPEEDTVLLAIEALEARTVDPDPEPWSPTPRTIPSLTTKPLPTIRPEISKVAKPVTAPKADVVVTQPTNLVKPTRAKSEPKGVVKAKPGAATAPLTVPPQPKKPATPAEEMAEELANAPAMSYFQFFWHQNKPRKPFIVIGIAVIIIGLGVGAYFATR